MELSPGLGALRDFAGNDGGADVNTTDSGSAVARIAFVLDHVQRTAGAGALGFTNDFSATKVTDGAETTPISLLLKRQLATVAVSLQFGDDLGAGSRDSASVLRSGQGGQLSEQPGSSDHGQLVLDEAFEFRQWVCLGRQTQRCTAAFPMTGPWAFQPTENTRKTQAEPCRIETDAEKILTKPGLAGGINYF